MVVTKPLKTHTCAGLFDGSHRLVDAVDELADMLKVSGHLCGQHHVNDGLSQGPELISVNSGEDWEDIEKI